MSVIKPLLVALSLAPTLALADSTFDFYLEGGSGAVSAVSYSPTYTVNGIGLTVTAKKANGTAAQVPDRWDGLGVVSGGFAELSEITKGESLVFTFNQAVNFNSLRLAQWEDLLDKATLTVGGTTVTLSTNSDILLDNFTFSGLTGTQFTLTGIQAGLLSTTSFRVAGLSVSAVPEPSSMLLAGLGLVGIACVRARRRA